MSIRPSLKGDKIDVEADSKDAGLTFESAMAKESGRNRVYGTNVQAGEREWKRCHVLICLCLLSKKDCGSPKAPIEVPSTADCDRALCKWIFEKHHVYYHHRMMASGSECHTIMRSSNKAGQRNILSICNPIQDIRGKAVRCEIVVVCLFVEQAICRRT